ncbi:peptidase [Thermoplasmatales archaeon ex4484_6]|nr:MAG: peptidase [Thermoplasmatales archaeon ex4484_6]RLF66478.1 MAG: Lon protease family protein [Thermoplasmata archaeon]
MSKTPSSPKGKERSAGKRSRGKRFPNLDIEDTSLVSIPSDPMKRVIGQDEAVSLAHVAAKQRRHLLLVGPPGTGKSMIAQALAIHLPPPQHQIYVVSNPEYPERPFIQVKSREEVEEEQRRSKLAREKVVSPLDVPVDVAEKLGYRCSRCGTYSPPEQLICPNCQAPKTPQGGPKVARVNLGMENMFKGIEDILKVTLNQLGGQKARIQTTRMVNGKEEVVVYEAAGPKIRILDEKALETRRELERASPKKILIPLKRKNFVMATGSSETELLGDVRHDPYGGHKGLGTPPYERVVPGAIHEAHEGVLFIDELQHLGHLQRFILTAMQEKLFSISGRNPQSAGASVKVDNVPCDFVFVGACNIQDLHHIISPLRSRITGSGYEVLVATTMPDTDENRNLFIQFIAQEVTMDGRIPHIDNSGIFALINEARRRARMLDRRNKSLTLRLRDMGGVIRAAGDIAVERGHELVTANDVKLAIKRSMTAEEQIREKFGALQGAVMGEMSESQSKQISPYNYWNENPDDIVGYE